MFQANTLKINVRVVSAAGHVGEICEVSDAIFVAASRPPQTGAHTLPIEYI